MTTAQNSGMWNSRLSATALPSTSARSQAPMADFAQQPVGPARPRGIPVAAALRQVFAGHHAQPGGDDLHEDRHQAGEPDHPQQAVLELRAALQVGAPVAGVHVADADQDRRPDERPPLLPEAGLVVRHLDRAVHAFQRHGCAVRQLGRKPGPSRAFVSVLVRSLSHLVVSTRPRRDHLQVYVLCLRCEKAFTGHANNPGLFPSAPAFDMIRSRPYP